MEETNLFLTDVETAKAMKKMTYQGLPELTCVECGFITHNPMDMIRHLACQQEETEENCVKVTLLRKDPDPVVSNGDKDAEEEDDD